MNANLLKSSEVMLRYAKTLLQNTIAVIAVVALTGSLLACDDTDDSEIDDFEIEELINDDTDIEDEF